MAIPSTQELRKALNRDLKNSGANGLKEVVDDVARKTFSAKIEGATLEFAHKQSDNEFWTGVKYYGSGSNSRVRFRRTRVVVEEKPASKRKRAAV